MFSLWTLTTASCSWLFLFTSCFLFPSLTLLGFLNGMLGVSEPGALNCYTLFRLIPLTLNLSSSFRIPGFSALQSHGTHSRSDIFFIDVANASGGVIIFIKQGLFFSELSTSSLSLLGPYFDYVEVNISLNNSSSLSFFNVYAPPICSSTKDSRTNFFSLSILPS